MGDELRVGVLGAGLVAGEHVNAYGMTPGARVVAVADPVPGKAAQLAAVAGAAAVRDLDELVAVGVAAVSICTPPVTHAALTVAALEAGLHVLCEKPIARSLEDAYRIVAASQAATGLLMIGQVSRFEPDHRKAKELVDAGYVGRVRMVSHSMTTSVPGWSEGGWLEDVEAAGGPLVDLGVHSFDFLSWLTESTPVRVHTVGADTPAGAATYAAATVRYDDGAMGLVETSWAHPASHGFKLRTEIIGTQGRLSWDYDSINGGAMYLADGPTSWFGPLGSRGFVAEIGAFTEAVRSGGSSPVPAEAGLGALRVAVAALESLRTARTIDLSSWGLP